MIDYNKPLRTGYFQRLNGAVFSDSLAVPVYSQMAPNDAVYPYIILSTQTGVESSTKNNQGQDNTILIDIVTGFIGAINDEVADDIADQIYGLVHPADKNFVDVGPNLQILSTDLLLDTTVGGQNNTYKLFRRLIRFGHKIHERTFN
ncbi:Protein of unknown function [Chitinophaga eiseniae]|uniref:Uncharacterized protein n=1 Tax=Chitinophaga eiseniae TaxID=634771 RepID=A0A1T4SNG3_9BACT|nr:DUF3168 domain-containing protein [Chitinophaga eiseniae]SKA29769.1 Protein of unknown function [Chitinophaga eiseniae]